VAETPGTEEISTTAINTADIRNINRVAGILATEGHQKKQLCQEHHRQGKWAGTQATAGVSPTETALASSKSRPTRNIMDLQQRQGCQQKQEI
jgi:hypothetical protein